MPFDEDATVIRGNATDWMNVVAAMYDEVGDKKISAISPGMDCAAAVGRGARSYMMAAQRRLRKEEGLKPGWDCPEYYMGMCR